MFNQKGQAFSVFELMIAAIVAIAILFVLLPMIYSIIGPQTSDPKTAIGNTLNSIKTGGDLTGQKFTLIQGQGLTSSDLSSSDIDSHSVVFAWDSKTAGSSDNYDAGVTDGEFSYFRYYGAVKITVSARVICAVTGKALAATLTTIKGLEFASDPDIEGLCGEEDYQPCCLVIIKK